MKLAALKMINWVMTLVDTHLFFQFQLFQFCSNFSNFVSIVQLFQLLQINSEDWGLRRTRMTRKIVKRSTFFFRTFMDVGKISFTITFSS